MAGIEALRLYMQRSVSRGTFYAGNERRAGEVVVVGGQDELAGETSSIDGAYLVHTQLLDSLFHLPPFISPLLALLTEPFPLHNDSLPTEEGTASRGASGSLISTRDRTSSCVRDDLQTSQGGGQVEQSSEGPWPTVM